jgi:UDP-glucose 4-epimerase
MEMIKTSESVTGEKINYEITGRRAGDPAVLVADNSKAKNILGWEPEFNLEGIISTAWNWHKNKRF